MGGIGGLEGWSWIFVSYVRASNSHINLDQIIEGLLTVVVGFFAFFGASRALSTNKIQC